jgi:penicillin-binding protein 1A
VGKKVALGLAAVLVVLGLAAASVGAWVLDVWNTAPSIDSLKPIDRGETSVVYAADGSRLGYIQSDSIRTPVLMDEIPDSLKEATVAIEDEHFYEHGGVDYEAVVRAAIKNVEAGHAVQGGSTITQQLVRNLYIAHPEETIERKIREAKLATELEDEHSKRWILGQYLNTASYGTNNGRTAVGVEAASQVYFNKHVSDLNLWEAALLAGLPQAPSEYNPLISPNQARARRNQVLRAMFEQGYISRHDERDALARRLGLERGYKYETIREPYFFDYVEQELINRYGVNTVRQGGLSVYTTINPGLQGVAQRAVDAGAASLGGPSAALASVDPTNGHIIAMASSSNYDASQYNLAANGHRQPGSSFKPFVLTTALKQGIDPDSTYYNSSSPITLTTPSGEPWHVSNAEDGTGGAMSITAGTTDSVNVVYAQLDLDVGGENVADTAHSLGITSPLDGYPAEGIGGLRVGVSPLEMADAYSTFANGGTHHDATAIARVTFPNGDVDEPDQPEGNRVISDGIAYEVTRILETVVDSGTGTAADYGCSDLAGKTGTTDDQTDAWFVGFSPTLSTGVWTGYPNARTSMGSSAFGGVYAAPIWNDFMSVASSSCNSFPKPTAMPDLSPYYSDHTASRSASQSSSSGYGYGSTTTTPTTPTPTPTTPSPGTGTGAYDQQQFQNGANPVGDG